MKKPVSTAAAALPVPSSYAFDDTPKAFKRMLQRKNNDQEAYKKSKQQQADHFPNKRSAEQSLKPTANNQKRSSDKPPSQVLTNTQPLFSLANGFKTVRAKRKIHLQSRDLKKKLKRFDATRELPLHPSNNRKDVRDVVQEPPKLHQLKKTFKKVKDEREEVKSWSEDEDELEEAVERKQNKFKKNK